jgi:hypothetical protein
MHINNDFDNGHDINYCAFLLCLVFPVTIDQAFTMLEGSAVVNGQELSKKDIKVIDRLRKQMNLHNKILLYEESWKEKQKPLSLSERIKLLGLEETSCKLNRIMI